MAALMASASIGSPRSKLNYGQVHFFIGVDPNDAPTLSAAREKLMVSATVMWG